MDLKGKDRKGRKRITVEEINKYDARSKILKIVAIAAAVLLLITYLFATLYKESGSFTISVNKHEMVKYGLSLCENKDLSKPIRLRNRPNILKSTFLRFCLL